MNNANNLSLLIGRIGLSAIFVVSGFGKLAAYAGTQQYMEAAGVPGALLPLVILAEVGGGLAVLSGFLTRTAAIGLAVFSVIAALAFHSHVADQMQSINFMKNIGLAGGFLALAASGAGKFSLDHWFADRGSRQLAHA